MEVELGWPPTQTSTLAGAMLWTYALGQLVNGWLGHHVNTRYMVFVGIVGSALANFLFVATSSYPLMIAIWLVNGFLQAMGWGPILRSLSDALDSSQRRRIAGAFGASYVVGNMLTWLLTGILLHNGEWRLVFIVPPLIMLAVGLAWFGLSRPARPSETPALALNLQSFKTVLLQLGHMLLSALVAGALINGALLYAPSYVAQTLPLDQAALTAIVFPLSGMVGTIWLSSWVLHRMKGDVMRSLIVLLLIAAAARGLAFFLPPTTASAVILLAGMGISSYALTNILLAAVPLTADATLGTSLVAGIMDSTHSIGGAIGSTMVGLLLVWGEWPLVFLVWTLLPILVVLLIGARIRRRAAAQLDPTPPI
jgi:sugar phosphate permease